MIYFPPYPAFPGGGFRRPIRRVVKRGTIAGAVAQAGESNVDQNTYQVASFTMAAFTMYVLTVYNTAAAPSLPLSIVDSRAGVTWARLPDTSTIVNGAHRVTKYYAFTGATAPGAGTIDLNMVVADATTGCAWDVVGYTGCVLGAGAFRSVQANLAAASLGQTLTLPTFEHVNNWHVYSIAHNANEVTAVGGGFTARSGLPHASPACTLQTADKVNDTTADPSWVTSSPSRWVHFELVSAF